jgi:hypothetical protein
MQEPPQVKNPSITLYPLELYKQNEDKEKKRDRQLENIIFFVGTAIGGGQIFSTAYPLIIETGYLAR